MDSNYEKYIDKDFLPIGFDAACDNDYQKRYRNKKDR